MQEVISYHHLLFRYVLSDSDSKSRSRSSIAGDWRSARARRETRAFSRSDHSSGAHGLGRADNVGNSFSTGNYLKSTLLLFFWSPGARTQQHEHTVGVTEGGQHQAREGQKLHCTDPWEQI